MKKTISLLLLSLALLFSERSLSAQDLSIQYLQGGPSLDSLVHGGRITMDYVGVRKPFLRTGLGLQAVRQLDDWSFSGGHEPHFYQFRAHILLFLLPAIRFRPYVYMAAVHTVREKELPYFDYTIGAGIRYFLARKFALNVDVERTHRRRYYVGAVGISYFVGRD